MIAQSHHAEISRKQRGVTVSDLHVFSDYTNAQEFLPLLHQAIERKDATGHPADMVVLNGDIFDFEYPKKHISFEDELEKLGFNLESEGDKDVLTKLGIWKYVQEDLNQYKPIKNVDAVLNLAIAWLYKFCEAHPQTQIHYVMGNHDGVYCPKGLDDNKKRDFPTRLKKLKKVLGQEGINFHFHKETFSPADNVMFTHGDLPMQKCAIYSRPMVPIDDILSPPPGGEGRTKQDAIEQWIYSNPTLLSMAHRYAGYHNRPGRIDPPVIRAQKKIHRGRKDEFHIFTGHTHVPRLNDVVDMQVKDPHTGENVSQRFLLHNTGSAVSRKEFNMLEFDLDQVRQPRPGKEDKQITVLSNVRRAQEVGQEPLDWVDKIKKTAIEVGYALPR